MHSLGMDAENDVPLLTQYVQKRTLNILLVYPQYMVFLFGYILILLLLCPFRLLLAEQQPVGR